jgi:hypothetical protein
VIFSQKKDGHNGPSQCFLHAWDGEAGKGSQMARIVRSMIRTSL